MAGQKVAVPKGMRDFSPLEVRKRKYLLNIIEAAFRRFGYEALETPAMENLSTLTGKYGDEGDKLLFRVLNSGDYLKGIELDKIGDIRPEVLAKQLCDRGMRYDLTVPFARYVANNWGELPHPFKRYQIQPVWRADRPQKGRYREFLQCDVDVVGTESLLCEVELIRIVEQVFGELGLKVTLLLNNRKILAGLAEVLGHPDKLVPMTVAIDKLAKTSAEAVREELRAAGFEEDKIGELLALLTTEADNAQTLGALDGMLAGNPQGEKGLEELRWILRYAEYSEVEMPARVSPSLARGLSYYTGAIFEVVVDSEEFNVSVCGGGRFDNLTGIFGLAGVTGVGISFGADRIYDALELLKLFPGDLDSSLDFLILNLCEAAYPLCVRMATLAHAQDYSCMIYPEVTKMRKQLEYADKRRALFAIIVGDRELEAQEVVVRNMMDGNQRAVPLDRVAEEIFGITPGLE